MAVFPVVDLYFILAGFHLIAVAVTGVLWTIIVVRPNIPLTRYHRDIKAVHFGSLYLAPLAIGLHYAFGKLDVPFLHQLVFPVGVVSLVFFAGVAYLFPKDPGRDRYYYWVHGWPLLLTSLGLGILALALLWTAYVLMRGALLSG